MGMFETALGHFHRRPRLADMARWPPIRERINLSKIDRQLAAA